MRLSPCSPETAATPLLGLEAVLDIGCGDGELLRYLKERSVPRLCGAEPDEASLNAARKACPEADIRLAHAEALPFADTEFDGAVMECVFSLTSPQEAVSELRRVLKPGGTAVIADVYARRAEAKLSDSPMVKHLYSRESFESFFADGFELQGFDERSESLTQMFINMVMDGELCSCVSKRDAALLRAAGAGYAVWIWRKIQ